MYSAPKPCHVPAVQTRFAAILLVLAAITAVPLRAVTIPGYTLLETISVATNGSTTTSTTSLALGVGYKLAAFGSFGIGGFRADAEYVYTSTTHYDYYVFGGGSPATVDYGIAINDPTVGGLKVPYWGPYTTTHEYIIDFVGLGGTIALKYHDDYYGDNDAPLTVQIFGVETPVSGVPDGGSTAGLLVVALVAGTTLQRRAVSRRVATPGGRVRG